MSDDTVLVVDDEEDFCRALAERMEIRGFKVEIAASGPEAIEKAKQQIYVAIVLDLMMPGMDGIETLKTLLAEHPDLQIILLTGHATLPKGVEAIKLGAMDFLEKPADFEQLLERIRQAKANRMVLVEKRLEERMNDIFQTRGW